MSFGSFYFIEKEEDDFDVVHDDQVYIDKNLDGEVDDEVKKELKKELEDDDDEDDDEDDKINEIKRSPRQKRQVARAKRSAIQTATGGKFYNSSLKDRAKFLSRFEFKKVTPTTGIFIPRKRPLPQLKLFRRLRKAAKVMRKFGRIRAKGKAAKKRSKGKF
jgi:hypothetical protein